MGVIFQVTLKKSVWIGVLWKNSILMEISIQIQNFQVKCLFLSYWWVSERILREISNKIDFCWKTAVKIFDTLGSVGCILSKLSYRKQFFWFKNFILENAIPKLQFPLSWSVHFFYRSSYLKQNQIKEKSLQIIIK